MKVDVLNEYNKTRCPAYYYLSTSTIYHKSQLAIDRYGVKGKVDLLNKYNKNKCVANRYLAYPWATTKFQFQFELSLAQLSPSLLY